MRLKVDQEADALYLFLNDSEIEDSEEVSPGIVVDFSAENEVVGIEILHLSKRTHKLNPRELVFETV
jgi:uncharacterized protein YuzE